jgi:hypothetical protein
MFDFVFAPSLLSSPIAVLVACVCSSATSMCSRRGEPFLAFSQANAQDLRCVPVRRVHSWAELVALVDASDCLELSVRVKLLP